MEFRTIVKIELKEFDRRTLDKTWEWLNDPEIKELTVTPDFTRESQEKWFQSIQNRDDYYIRVVYTNDEPIGVFGIKNITRKDAELWGYIGDKRYWGKAIAVEAINFLIDYGKSLKLESIYGKLLKSNVQSYKICRRFGFEIDEDPTLGDNMMKMRLYLNK